MISTSVVHVTAGWKTVRLTAASVYKFSVRGVILFLLFVRCLSGKKCSASIAHITHAVFILVAVVGSTFMTCDDLSFC